jgi:hypothetical protein
MTPNEIKQLIDENLRIKAEYERLVSDELTERGEPGGASDEMLAACEKTWHMRLPQSYRQLLQLRDGIRFFDGDSHILSTADLMQDWVRRECALKGEMFVEFSDANPFAQGALPVMIGEDSNALLLWQPSGDDGAGVFVEYDIVEQIDEYETLFDYIRDDTEIVSEMVSDEAEEAE